MPNAWFTGGAGGNHLDIFTRALDLLRNVPGVELVHRNCSASGSSAALSCRDGVLERTKVGHSVDRCARERDRGMAAESRQGNTIAVIDAGMDADREEWR